VEFRRGLTSHPRPPQWTSSTQSWPIYDFFNRKWNAQSRKAKCLDFSNITISNRKRISFPLTCFSHRSSIFHSHAAAKLTVPSARLVTGFPGGRSFSSDIKPTVLRGLQPLKQKPLTLAVSTLQLTQTRRHLPMRKNHVAHKLGRRG
jgi:hypothetical protein